MKKRFGTHFVTVGLLLGSMAATMPVSSRAAVYFEEGFESGLGAWEQGNLSTIQIVSDVAFDGARSLRLTYSDVGTSAGCCAITRRFPATGDVYIRYYYRLSAGFQASGSQTKIMFVGPYPDYSDYPTLWLSMFEDKQHCVYSQGAGGSRGCINQGAPMPFQDNRWYCVESHIKDNVVKEAWIDGVLKVSYPGEPPARSGHTYSAIQIYQERGNGFSWYDKIAVGNTRIGCSNNPPDTQQPAAPTNVVVN